MPKYTIYTDIEISKSKKVHAVSTEPHVQHSWHPTVISVLEGLYDAGVTEALIIADDRAFKITFERATVTGSDPFLPLPKTGGPEGVS
ncbi:MAG: hypothetical protein V3S54_09295 [Woeseiaceae bacterium]